MAASQDGKTFKQDMVVSIRYRNDLPPPPMPPKLLDIEHGGIQQYLTTGYAAGLARREDPNIDADAEGGMPIDMIGLPGYFLGDESIIMASDVQPVLDPADAALMMTPDQLRTEGARTKGVSFLRKTEYMNSANAKAGSDPLLKPNSKSRKSMDQGAPVARDDPINIKRHLQKSFDLAYPESVPFNDGQDDPLSISAQERQAWNNPVHPNNPSLKPVSYHPIIPDLEAVTDGGGNWNYVKFLKPPLLAMNDRRDDRIDAGFIAAVPNQKEHAKWQAQKDAYDRDPQKYDDPGNEPYIWSLHVPRHHSSTSKVRRMFNDGDPQKDNPDWFEELTEQDATGQLRVPFTRVRAYPTVKQDFTDARRFMAVSMYDPATAKSRSRLREQGPAAYYYPVMERYQFRIEGGKPGAGVRNATQRRADELDDLTRDLPDELMLLPLQDVPALQQFARSQFKGKYDKDFAEQLEQLEQAAIAEQKAQEAENIEDEQGLLHQGAQDVSMAEINAADDMEVVGNGQSKQDRDNESKHGTNGHVDDELMDDSD